MFATIKNYTYSVLIATSINLLVLSTSNLKAMDLVRVQAGYRSALMAAIDTMASNSRSASRAKTPSTDGASNDNHLPSTVLESEDYSATTESRTLGLFNQACVQSYPSTITLVYPQYALESYTHFRITRWKDESAADLNSSLKFIDHSYKFLSQAASLRPTSLECPSCKITIKEKTEMQNHLDVFHGNEKLWACLNKGCFSIIQECNKPNHGCIKKKRKKTSLNGDEPKAKRQRLEQPK